jgi:hypothetical protein
VLSASGYETKQQEFRKKEVLSKAAPAAALAIAITIVLVPWQLRDTCLSNN